MSANPAGAREEQESRATMFPTYNSLAEVPEAFREHYVMRSGKAVAEVSTDHPLVVNNATLLSQKEAAETAKAEAERKKAEAESALASANVLPRGHEAVPKADAELVRAVKAAGVETADAFTTMKTELDTIKPKMERQERRENLDKLRKDLGWSDAAVDVLELVPDLPPWEYREVTVGGQKKQVPHAKIKTGEEVRFKPFSDYFQEKHAVLLPSVQKAQQGTSVHGSVAGSSASAQPEIVDDFIKKRDEAAASKPSPFNRKQVVAA